MSTRAKTVAAALVVAGATALSGTAHADEVTLKDTSVHESRPTKIDFTGSLLFLGDFGVGIAGWYSMPLVKDGFIPAINDSFMLELGAVIDYRWADYGYIGGSCGYHYIGVNPMGGVRWDFYLNKSWTVFAKAKIGVGYDFASVSCNGSTVSGLGGTHIPTDGGVGAYWNISEKMAMRFDLGYNGAAVGLSFNL